MLSVIEIEANESQSIPANHNNKDAFRYVLPDVFANL